MAMIPALSPTLPVASAPLTGAEVAGDGSFAAQMTDEEISEPDADEVMIMALVSLPASAPPPPAAEDLTGEVAAPAVPPPDAMEADGTALPDDPAPPSTEAALRLQMAEQAEGREGPEIQVEGEGEGKTAEAPRAHAPAALPAPSAAEVPSIALPSVQMAPAPHAPPVAHSAEHPHAIARQVAEGLSTALAAPAAADRIELTLRPEELGRVRFEIRGEGDKLMVTLTADRPETMDLLRRHLPDLMAELEQAGYGGASLNFGQPGHSGSGSAGTGADAFIGTPDLPDLPPSLPPHPMGSGGLDLRL